MLEQGDLRAPWGVRQCIFIDWRSDCFRSSDLDGRRRPYVALDTRACTSD